MNAASSVIPLRLAAAVVGAFGVLAITLFSAWVLSAAPMLGMFSDTVAYLVLADFFAAHAAGGHDPVLSAAFATTRFPPLYPVLLAAAGAGLDDPGPAVLLCSACVAAMVGGFVAWQWREGYAWPAAALLPVACCAPGVVDWLLTAPSEPLFVALLLAALALAPRQNAVEASLLPLALLVGVLPLARSAGWAVVAGLIAWMVLQPERSRTARALSAIVSLLPGLAWTAYRWLEPVQNAYVGALDRFPGLDEPAAWIEYLSVQLAAAWLAFRHWFGAADAAVATVGVAALAGLALAGVAVGLRAPRLEAWILVFYLPLILAWPYPDEMPRLLGVAMPLLAVSMWHAVARSMPRQAGAGAPIAAALVLGVLALALALPRWHAIHARASADVDPALADAQRSLAYFGASSDAQALAGLELIAHARGLIRAIPEAIPAGACVYTVLPAFAQFELGRRVEIVDLPEIHAAAPDVAARLERCDYVLGVFLEAPQRSAPALYPLSLLAGRALPVLVADVDTAFGRITAAALVRVEREADGPAQD
jgi:hypothetical protein